MSSARRSHADVFARDFNEASMICARYAHARVAPLASTKVANRTKSSSLDSISETLTSNVTVKSTLQSFAI